MAKEDWLLSPKPIKTTESRLRVIPTSGRAGEVAKDHLSQEREARQKGLQLAARIERLYQTDEEFRKWYHEGIDDLEAGRFVTFSADGWKEE